MWRADTAERPPRYTRAHRLPFALIVFDVELEYLTQYEVFLSGLFGTFMQLPPRYFSTSRTHVGPIKRSIKHNPRGRYIQHCLPPPPPPPPEPYQMLPPSTATPMAF